MQLTRLFEIVYLLLERGSATAAELAERFEVSTRTIYRDLDVLSGAGVPVYAVKGRGGGIRLMPGFVLDRSLLSESEQNEILFALQTISATRAGAAEPVLSRLRGMFQRGGIDWIEADFSPWGSGDEAREGFTLLKTGILENRVTWFDYYGADGCKSERRVEPLALRFKSNCWYLQAYCLARRDFRTFRVSRMENIRLTGERFARREPIPPLEPSPPPGISYVKLELRFSSQAAYRVYDNFCHSAVQPGVDGSLTVRAEFPDEEWVYGFLLSFGDGVEVISPPSVRASIMSRAENIRLLYAAGK